MLDENLRNRLCLEWLGLTRLNPEAAARLLYRIYVSVCLDEDEAPIIGKFAAVYKYLRIGKTTAYKYLKMGESLFEADANQPAGNSAGLLTPDDANQSKPGLVDINPRKIAEIVFNNNIHF